MGGGRGQSRFASWKCLYCVMYSNGGQPGLVFFSKRWTHCHVSARAHMSACAHRGGFQWGWGRGVALDASGSTLPGGKKPGSPCLFTGRIREVRAGLCCNQQRTFFRGVGGGDLLGGKLREDGVWLVYCLLDYWLPERYVRLGRVLSDVVESSTEAPQSNPLFIHSFIHLYCLYSFYILYIVCSRWMPHNLVVLFVTMTIKAFLILKVHHWTDSKFLFSLVL